jgi:hypothetical protein
LKASGQLYEPNTLPLVKGPLLSTEQEAEYVHQLDGCFGEQISLFIMPEIKPYFLDYPGPSLAIILKTQPLS